MKISEIMKQIEEFAPLGLALSWDNSGLQVGDLNSEVENVYITLDVTSTAVQKALENECQLILSHHPLIFQQLKNITNPLYLEIIKNNLSVISLHTNLDVAEKSVNHSLAQKLGLEVIGFLSSETGATNYIIVVYCPLEDAEKIMHSAWSAGAGKIGNYYNCANKQESEGYYKASENAKPYKDSGIEGHIAETCLQFCCESFHLNDVLNAIRQNHPYETPLIYHYEVANPNPAYGLGLICKYNAEINLQDLAILVKERLNCPQVKLWTASFDLHKNINRIAICGGSGSSLISAAQKTADVLITGDISYHGFLESKIPLIDAGHFYTEYPALQLLADFVNKLQLHPFLIPQNEHLYTQNLLII